MSNHCNIDSMAPMDTKAKTSTTRLKITCAKANRRLGAVPCKLPSSTVLVVPKSAPITNAAAAGKLSMSTCMAASANAIITELLWITAVMITPNNR